MRGSRPPSIADCQALLTAAMATLERLAEILDTLEGNAVAKPVADSHSPQSIQPAVPREGLATVKDAAKFLSISRANLYRMIDAGQIQSVSYGRSRRIPWSVIHELAKPGRH